MPTRFLAARSEPSLAALVLEDDHVSLRQFASESEAFSVRRPFDCIDPLIGRAGEMKIGQSAGSATGHWLQPNIIHAPIVPLESDVLTVRCNRCAAAAIPGYTPGYFSSLNRHEFEFDGFCTPRLGHRRYHHLLAIGGDAKRKVRVALAADQQLGAAAFHRDLMNTAIVKAAVDQPSPIRSAAHELFGLTGGDLAGCTTGKIKGVGVSRCARRRGEPVKTTLFAPQVSRSTIERSLPEYSVVRWPEGRDSN